MLFAQGKFDEAEQWFLHRLRESPKNAEALNNLAVIAHRRGDLGRAEVYLLEARAADPASGAALANLADLYIHLKRWPEAAGALECLVALSARDAKALNQLAVARLEMGDAAGAREAMARSLQADAHQPVVRESLARLAAPQGPQAASVRPAPAAEAGPPASAPLNILFVQETPCIRNYKMAVALRAAGHRVTLAYTRSRLSQAYPELSDETYDECVLVRDYRQLWDLTASYDIVHCHNEPDLLTVAALAGTAPVVHDTHDLISLRRPDDANLAFFEGVANRAADGRVYTTPYQMEEARNLYGVTGPSLVLHNYVSQGDLPRRKLPKLSQADGQVHLVYEGGVRARGHRDFGELFRDLAARGLHVHVYPMKCDEEVARQMTGSPNLHYHQPVSPKQIIEEMTQYDFGIIPFNLDQGKRRFLDTTIANKLYEYLAAGLPVIATDLRSYREYFREHPVGLTYAGADDIVAAIPALRKMAATEDLAACVRSFEQETPRLVAFYRQVLAGGARRPRGAAVNEPAAPVPAPSSIEDEERRKYEEIYSVGYNHHAGLKDEIVAFLERYTPEFETAIDLGCGNGKYAHFLQEKHGKMVLGVDIVEHLKFPNVRFLNKFAWDLDVAADFLYAIDLLEHVPETKVEATLRAIAGHARLFFADVSTLKDKLGDKIGKRLHLTLRPPNWWVGRLAEVFEDVKVLGMQPDGFFVECRHEPVPAWSAGGRAVPEFAAVTGRPSSQYRDFWNRHAATLPWRGRVLNVGTNDACRAYYTPAFFGTDAVVHVDIDPAVRPDVVTSVEDMPMFPDQSVDGIAFFGTPYVVNDPARMVREFLRVLRPGGLVSGAFNGPESPWKGIPYRPGEVKTSGQAWHFDRRVREFFESACTTLAWSRHGDAYYYLSAVKGA